MIKIALINDVSLGDMCFKGRLSVPVAKQMLAKALKQTKLDSSIVLNSIWTEFRWEHWLSRYGEGT